jgi:hypothetical protein
MPDKQRSGSGSSWRGWLGSWRGGASAKEADAQHGGSAGGDLPPADGGRSESSPREQRLPATPSVDGHKHASQPHARSAIDGTPSWRRQGSRVLCCCGPWLLCFPVAPGSCQRVPSGLGAARGSCLVHVGGGGGSRWSQGSWVTGLRFHHGLREAPIEGFELPESHCIGLSPQPSALISLRAAACRHGGHLPRKRSWLPTPGELSTLESVLVMGQNTIEFTFGRERLRAYIYFMPWNTRLVRAFCWVKESANRLTDP